MSTTPNRYAYTAVPTTTYSFTFTTFSGTSTVPFSTPTSSPTVYPFAPADNCPPIPENPLGLKASCVISNARNVSDHAFWDLYACCNGAYPQSFGGENMCTATCVAEGQSWQELMSCLEKRAPLVVCKPDYLEIDRNETAAVRGSGTTASATGADLTQTLSLIHI